MKVVDLEVEGHPDFDIGLILDEIRTACGVDHVAYCGLSPALHSAFGAVTYSEEWKTYYHHNNLIEKDPTLHVARRSIAPVEWSNLYASEEGSQFLNTASEFGLGKNGVTIPVHGPFGEVGFLSVTSSSSAKEWSGWYKSILSELHKYSVYAHDAVMQSHGPLTQMRRPTLSSRETEVLSFAAAGQSMAKIGYKLGIAEKTVELHLRSARTKLNSLNTAQAVGRAVRLGIVKL